MDVLCAASPACTELVIDDYYSTGIDVDWAIATVTEDTVRGNVYTRSDCGPESHRSDSQEASPWATPHLLPGATSRP